MQERLTDGSHKPEPRKGCDNAPGYKIDIGCGVHKKPGHIGVDIAPRAAADVVANPERGLPFGDNTFSEVWMSHVFEHLADPVRAMDELWRVSHNGARIEIRGPHFSTPSLIWGDPTHRRGLSLSTFRYFDGTWHGARSKFDISSCVLKRGNTEISQVGAKFWYWPFIMPNWMIERFVNSSLAWIARYERLGTRFFGFQELQIVLTVIK